MNLQLQSAMHHAIANAMGKSFTIKHVGKTVQSKHPLSYATGVGNVVEVEVVVVVVVVTSVFVVASVVVVSSVVVVMDDWVVVLVILIVVVEVTVIVLNWWAKPP